MTLGCLGGLGGDGLERDGIGISYLTGGSSEISNGGFLSEGIMRVLEWWNNTIKW